MMERPLLITDIMRFADRNHPDVENRLGHDGHAAAPQQLARDLPPDPTTSPMR